MQPDPPDIEPNWTDWESIGYMVCLGLMTFFFGLRCYAKIKLDQPLLCEDCKWSTASTLLVWPPMTVIARVLFNILGRPDTYYLGTQLFLTHPSFFRHWRLPFHSKVSVIHWLEGKIYSNHPRQVVQCGLTQPADLLSPKQTKNLHIVRFTTRFPNVSH